MAAKLALHDGAASGSLASAVSWSCGNVKSELKEKVAPAPRYREFIPTAKSDE